MTEEAASGARGGDGDSDGGNVDGSDGGEDGPNGDITNVFEIPSLDVSREEVSDDEVEPVELLVQLAEDGEIRPWEIDIVRVTDAFLDRLEAVDLRTSGRALFYASVLLRMKSDELLADDGEDESEPGPEPWETAGGGLGPADGRGEMPVDGADGDGFDPVDALEAEMDRRLERKRARGSPETLEELVRELREAERESWWKRRREYDTTDDGQGQGRGRGRGPRTVDYEAVGTGRRDDGPDDAAAATERTHDEGIEEVIDEVEAALSSRYDAGRDEVLFDEIETAGGRPFMTFLALLFLADRGAVRLRQDELFGDLWIRDPNAPRADAEAVAD